MTHRQAVACMVLCAMLWGTGGVLSRQLQQASGMETTFWRALFAAITVLAWHLVCNRERLVAALRSADVALWASALMWAVMFTFFTLALSLAQVAHVLITMSLAPVFTALLASVVFRRRLGARSWVVIAVASGGIALMYAFDIRGLDRREALGVLLAFGVPVAAAINWVIVQRSGARTELTVSVLLGALLCCAASLPMAWPPRLVLHDAVVLATMGVFQLGVPCILAVLAARALAAHEQALLALLEVVGGIALVWIVTGEQPGTATLAGGTLVLAALAYNELRRSPARDGSTSGRPP